MNVLNITLSDDGAFEIISPIPGKRDFKIKHDSTDACHPWKVISEMGGSGVWREDDSFQSLDEALDWSVSLSTETFPVPGYGVTLPCGTFFSRPGKVKIEDVMASIGWTYVLSVDGWSPIMYPKGTSKNAVISYFQNLVEDTAAVLGSVDRCPPTDGEDDNGQEMWVADITIPVYGFIHSDHAQSSFASIFEDEGIPCMDAFDYTTRTNVTPHSATIIDFASALKARELSQASHTTNSAEAGR
jgi:hypothetical protein